MPPAGVAAALSMAAWIAALSSARAVAVDAEVRRGQVDRGRVVGPGGEDRGSPRPGGPRQEQSQEPEGGPGRLEQRRDPHGGDYNSANSYIIS